MSVRVVIIVYTWMSSDSNKRTIVFAFLMFVFFSHPFSGHQNQNQNINTTFTNQIHQYYALVWNLRQGVMLKAKL